MKTFTFSLFISLLIFSCTDTESTIATIKDLESDSDTMGDKPKLTTINTSIPIKPLITNENIVSFNISNCKHESRNDKGRIIQNEISNDTLTFKIGHWFNCIHSSSKLLDFYQNNEVLNLKITATEIDKGRNEIVIEAAAECDCYFIFEGKIKGISSLPSKLMINGSIVENENPYGGEAE